MKHSIALIWCVSLIAAASMPAPTLQAAIDARVAAPGTAIAVGVIDHGKVETYFAGTTGNDRPLDEHTLFEIGSVTKTFTATLLASMVLAHQVKLDDPAAAYLPKSVHVPGRDGLSITLLGLAEQRSGLPRLPSNMDDVAGTDPYVITRFPTCTRF
jgi:D-alanyl-D-alanine-carboxypeptidase/D-alanyl-D-alanine-endopeptidase